MYNLLDYISKEILVNSRNKYLSFIKMLFKLGVSNATLLIRIYLITVNKKSVFYRIISIFAKNRLLKIYGIEIGKNTKIGMGLKLGHANGIIIGEGVEIGENVTIYQQVTFGISKISDMGILDAYPKIGNNCVIYAGAKIFGNIVVGNGTVVGANSVLVSSTEENSVYVGLPAQRKK